MILLEHVEKGKTEIRSVVPGDEGGKGDWLQKWHG